MSKQLSINSSEPHRLKRGLWIALAAFAVVGILVLYRFNPMQHAFYPRCLFHAVTGLDCPGCGGLRATHQLLHGNVRAAFELNPLLVCAASLLLAAVPLWIFNRRRIASLFAQMKSGTLAWSLAAVVIVFGVLRNLPWRAWLS